MKPLRTAVIGVGHLGKEHARILAGLPEVELVGVADVNAAQAEAVAVRCGTRGHGDFHALIADIDAAIVAVPTTFHHAVASDLLRRGISLLVEKPLAATLEEAEELVALAEQHGAILQVGHIERFNPAFEELQRRPLQPKYIEVERLGPFSGRSMDTGVVLDLMIHDLDLLLALVRSPVRTVDALGVSLFGPHEDVANVRLRFANGCVANVTASRASTTPVRQLRAWAPEGYVRLDYAKRTLTLMQPTDQLRCQVASPGRLDAVALKSLKEEFFGRHVLPLHLDCHGGDQLTRELQHFVRCVQTGSRPRVNGADARDAMAVATRVLESIRTHPWEGRDGGATGPGELPAALGPLFTPPAPAAPLAA